MLSFGVALTHLREELMRLKERQYSLCVVHEVRRKFYRKARIRVSYPHSYEAGGRQCLFYEAIQIGNYLILPDFPIG